MAKIKKTKSGEDHFETKPYLFHGLSETPFTKDRGNELEWREKAKEKTSPKNAAKLLRDVPMRGTLFYPRCYHDVLATMQLSNVERFIFADKRISVPQFEELLSHVEEHESEFRILAKVRLPWKVVRDVDSRFLHEDDYRFENQPVPRGIFIVVELPTGCRKYIFFFTVHPLAVYKNIFCKLNIAPEYLCIKAATGHWPDAESVERWKERLATEVRNGPVLPRRIIADGELGDVWGQTNLTGNIEWPATPWNTAAHLNIHTTVIGNDVWLGQS